MMILYTEKRGNNERNVMAKKAIRDSNFKEKKNGIARYNLIEV